MFEVELIEKNVEEVHQGVGVPREHPEDQQGPIIFKLKSILKLNS